MAIHKGNFKERFGIDVECYVVDDATKTAVISQKGMGKALGLSDRGNAFPRFLASQAMSDFVGAELKQKLENPLKFQWGSGGADQPPALINGNDATLLIDVCDANRPDLNLNHHLQGQQVDAKNAPVIYSGNLIWVDSCHQGSIKKPNACGVPEPCYPVFTCKGSPQPLGECPMLTGRFRPYRGDRAIASRRSAPATKTNTMHVVVFSGEESDGDWPPTDPDGFLAWFGAKFDGIPLEHRGSATVRVSSVDQYNEEVSSARIEIEYWLESTSAR